MGKKKKKRMAVDFSSEKMEARKPQYLPVLEENNLYLAKYSPEIMENQYILR